MNCPSCGHFGMDVKDSRPADYGIRRRRLCPSCGDRFTTFELIAPDEPVILTRRGRLVPVRIASIRAVLMAAVGAALDLTLPTLVAQAVDPEDETPPVHAPDPERGLSAYDRQDV